MTARVRAAFIADVDATLKVRATSWRSRVDGAPMAATTVYLGDRFVAAAELDIAGVDVARQLAELRRIGRRLIVEADRAGHQHRTRRRAELLAEAVAAVDARAAA